MDIIYKHRRKLVTEQQALEIGEFYKLFLENGEVRKKERYDSNILKAITFYLSPTDIETEIVQELTPLVEDFVLIRDARIPIQSYFLINERTYKNGVLSSKNRYLYDSLDNIVCIEWVDLLTNQPVFNKTTKYYYGGAPVTDATSIFEAEYEADGSLERIDIPDPYDPDDSRVYDTGNFSELQARFTEDIGYYLDATLEPS